MKIQLDDNWATPPAYEDVMIESSRKTIELTL